MSGVVAVVSLFCLGLVAAGPTCTPQGNGEMVTKFKNSDVVVQGYPKFFAKDNSGKGDDLMVVDFEVKCVFKGGPLDKMIRIFNVGALDLQCNKIELTKDSITLVYLRRVGDRLEASFLQDHGTVAYIDEILSMCGVVVSAAKGYSAKETNDMCPTVDPDYDACQASAEEDEDDSEARYQPVKSGDNDNGDQTNVEVNVDQSGNTGGNGENPKEESMGGGSSTEKPAKSGDMKMKDEKEEVGATTPVNKGVGCSLSWVTSLVTIVAVGIFSVL